MRALALLLIASSAASVSAQTGGVRNVPTFAFATCGRFVEMKDDPQFRHNASTYTRGYLSGANVFRRDGKAVRQEMPDSTIVLYLEKFCRENPLSQMTDGVVALTQELSR